MSQSLPKAHNLTVRSLTVHTASTLIAKANPYRRYLAIQNASDTQITIDTKTAVVDGQGIILQPATVATRAGGTMYEFCRERNLTQQAIYAITSVAGKRVTVIETSENIPDAPTGGTGASSSSSSSSSESSSSESSGSSSSPSSCSSSSESSESSSSNWSSSSESSSSSSSESSASNSSSSSTSSYSSASSSSTDSSGP